MQEEASKQQEAICKCQNKLAVAREVHNRLCFARIHASLRIKGVIAAQMDSHKDTARENFTDCCACGAEALLRRAPEQICSVFNDCVRSMPGDTKETLGSSSRQVSFPYDHSIAHFRSIPVLLSAESYITKWKS